MLSQTVSTKVSTTRLRATFSSRHRHANVLPFSFLSSLKMTKTRILLPILAQALSFVFFSSQHISQSFLLALHSGSLGTRHCGPFFLGAF